jgi:DNA-binding protein HU-beta
MNQSELVDKVAQKTTLTQTAAAEAVKAVVQAVLESLVAGEPVRVSGLGTFNVAARPARGRREQRRAGRYRGSHARHVAMRIESPS